jgi:HK97 family phage prohead protease
MERKLVTLEIKDVAETGEFSGYASTFGNEDLGGDIIMPGAFTKTIKENKNVPVLWGHSSREVIGVNQDFSEDAKGLKVKGKLTLGVQRAKEARELMVDKAVRGLSIGYDAIIIDWSREKEGIRILREIKLWEYSLTPFPMNPEAQVTGVKSVEEFEQLLHRVIAFGSRKHLQLSAEDAALIEQAMKTLSALQAAKAPEAAKHDSIAPEILHAALKDRYAYLKGESQ